MSKKYAKYQRCCECGKQAVAYWPTIDPDIPDYPYCRECLDKAKMELLTELYKIKQRKKKNNKNFPRGC